MSLISNSPAHMATHENEILLSEEVIKLSLCKDDVPSDSKDSSKKVAVPLKMSLAHHNLRRMDNTLCGYGAITSLFLNNNHIEVISGLDHLVQLRHLDLSFNAIAEIKGLDSCLNLNVLSIYHNRIKEIGGIDHCTELTSLSLGRNLISTIVNGDSGLCQLKSLVKLKDLNLAGNPVTQSKDYQHKILLEVPHLVYLNDKKVVRGEQGLPSDNECNPKMFRHIIQDLEHLIANQGHNGGDYAGPMGKLSTELGEFQSDLSEKEKYIRGCIDPLHNKLGTCVHETLQSIDFIIGAQSIDRQRDAMNVEIAFCKRMHEIVDPIKSKIEIQYEGIDALFRAAIERFQKGSTGADWNEISSAQKEEIQQKTIETVEARIHMFRSKDMMEIDDIREQALRQHYKRLQQISKMC